MPWCWRRWNWCWKKCHCCLRTVDITSLCIIMTCLWTANWLMVTCFSRGRREVLGVPRTTWKCVSLAVCLDGFVSGWSLTLVTGRCWCASSRWSWVTWTPAGGSDLFVRNLNLTGTSCQTGCTRFVWDLKAAVLCVDVFASVFCRGNLYSVVFWVLYAYKNFILTLYNPHFGAQTRFQSTILRISYFKGPLLRKSAIPKAHYSAGVLFQGPAIVKVRYSVDAIKIAKNRVFFSPHKKCDDFWCSTFNPGLLFIFNLLHCLVVLFLQWEAM